MKNPRPALIVSLIPALIVLCAALSCGKNPFASSTDVGQTIVDDFNPMVTNVDENIKTFSGVAVIDSAFSIRNTGDSLFSWWRRDSAVLAWGAFPGISKDNRTFSDSAYLSFQFSPGIFRRPEYETDRNNLKSARSIEGIFLRFNVIIGVKTKFPSMNFNFDYFTHSFVSDTTPGAIITDSVFVNLGLTEYGKQILNQIQSAISDTGDTSSFTLRYSPMILDSGIFHIDNSYIIPKILIYYRSNSSTDTALKSVTLNRNRAWFHTIESDSAAACAYPFSSWETGRHAVFKLSVAPLREYINNGSAEGKKYQVIPRAELHISLSKFISDIPLDSVQVYFTLLNTLAYTGDSFNKIGLFWVKNTPNKDTVYTLRVEQWLQKIIVQDKSDKVFLYLMVPTQPGSAASAVRPFIQLDWTQPQARLELNAVVMNPR